ncbi:VOC family protein [Actinomyces timonensis]|uniref:VOC family protein n=1 Tax=Actinomyces timonensis TaxID=1288391 RepID=UPI0002FFD077|nr:VOC family protein [Actinomyces timonensis]
MIDHLSLGVSDPSASSAFYTRALAPLGYRVLAEHGPVIGLGIERREDGPNAELWLVPADTPTVVHLALTAESTEQVDAFYEAALAAGGSDNGSPGERPQYHPGYYGAFVLDPDGHNIEAVFHG